MLKIIVLCAAIVTNLAAAEGQSREVVYLGMNECPQGGCRSPIFDKGYLIQMKDYQGAPPDGFTIYDPSGREMYQVDILAPDGTLGHLRGAAVDADGTVGVAFDYGGWGGRGHVKGGAIVLVERNGNQRLFAETGRWLPSHLAFAQDHSIWAMGTQFAPLRAGVDKDWVTKDDYSVVHKYSASGKLEGEYLPRSTFPPGLQPASSGIGWMRAFQDRIGLMTYPGQISINPEWVELSLDGTIAGRWQLGPDLVADNEKHRAVLQRGRVVLTADGRLLTTTRPCPEPSKCSNQLVLFDKPTSTWQSSNALPQDLLDNHHLLIGADGGSLVFEDRRGGVRLLWVPVQSTNPAAELSRLP